MPSSASEVQQRAETGMGNLFDGSSNEDLAKAHFKKWRWTAGKPEPDIGNDLVVEIPAKDGQAGATFSVQVRSGKRWKAAETIKRASAARLHGSPLPAFLMYVHRPNGEVRWTYLEPLFEADPAYLDGGDLRVPLSASRSFPLLSAKPDKAFLDAVMRAKGRSAMKSVGSMGGLARAIHDHYEQLDPALRVSASFVDGRNILSIAARGEPVAVSMSIRDLADGGVGAFRDAIEWGRTAILEAGAFTLTGSPLFEYLTRQNSLTRLEVMPESVWEG